MATSFSHNIIQTAKSLKSWVACCGVAMQWTHGTVEIKQQEASLGLVRVGGHSGSVFAGRRHGTVGSLPEPKQLRFDRHKAGCRRKHTQKKGTGRNVQIKPVSMRTLFHRRVGTNTTKTQHVSTTKVYFFVLTSHPSEMRAALSFN